MPQVYVDVDRDKALKQGVPVNEVYQTLQADAENRLTPEAIGQFFVRNNDGNMVPLSALNNLARTRRDRLVSLVQLYRALGGGWQE